MAKKSREEIRAKKELASQKKLAKRNSARAAKIKQRAAKQLKSRTEGAKAAEKLREKHRLEKFERAEDKVDDDEMRRMGRAVARQEKLINQIKRTKSKVKKAA